jgi:hypothetical protein
MIMRLGYPILVSLQFNFILSDAKSVNIRDKKKLRFSEVKKKNVIFTFIADRFLYQTENHDH